MICLLNSTNARLKSTRRICPQQQTALVEVCFLNFSPSNSPVMFKLSAVHAADTDITSVVAALSGLAVVYQNKHNYVKATELFRESLEMMLQTLPKDNANVITGILHICCASINILS